MKRQPHGESNPGAHGHAAGELRGDTLNGPEIHRRAIAAQASGLIDEKWLGEARRAETEINAPVRPDGDAQSIHAMLLAWLRPSRDRDFLIRAIIPVRIEQQRNFAFARDEHALPAF